MSKSIVELLKEATKDILSEEILKEIETEFNKAVETKSSLHAEKALMEQDEDYAKKLKTLLEAVDVDHTKKLNQVVEALDKNYAGKLQNVVKKFSTGLVTEAGSFKTDLVSQISKYLELYLEEKLPLADIQEAVKNKKAFSVLSEMRGLLSVDMALAKDSIRDAVVDGKTKIDEAAKQLEAVKLDNTKLSQALNKTNAELVLEKNLNTVDSTEKKAYLKKMLRGKSAEFITENFRYTLGLFDKTEEERLDSLKTQATSSTVTQTNNVDRVVIEESSKKTNSDHEDFSTSSYMTELKKY